MLKVDLTLQGARDPGRDIIAGDRSRSAEAFESDTAPSKDVDPFVPLPGENLFGGHVARSTDECPTLGCEIFTRLLLGTRNSLVNFLSMSVILFMELAQTEIENFDLVRIIQHDVLRLEISVENPIGMGSF